MEFAISGLHASCGGDIKCRQIQSKNSFNLVNIETRKTYDLESCGPANGGVLARCCKISFPFQYDRINILSRRKCTKLLD